MGPDQRQGQLPVRRHRQRVRRRVRAERHAAVADRPGPQHPGRRALHAVPGLRLRRRRQGRGRDEDRGRHPVRHRAGDRRRQRRLPEQRRLRADRARVLHGVHRPDRRDRRDHQLRPAPRHGLQLGRQLRQPRRPVPRRHRVPRRSAAVDHHGPRLLHACRRRGVGLPQRPADPALDVRLEQLHLRQQHVRRAGQPLAVGGRRGPGRQAGDPLRRRGDRRQRRRACGTPAPGTGTRATWAT